MTETLKPCPFCGGEAKLIDMEGLYHRTRIACQNRSCVRPGTLYHNKAADAIEAWNTRKGSAEEAGARLERERIVNLLAVSEYHDPGKHLSGNCDICSMIVLIREGEK